MGSSIAPEICLFVRILTQDFTTRSKAAADQAIKFFLSKNDPMPRWNGPVLTLDQIIKFVMSSASQAELVTLFITAQEMVATRNTLEEMRWPQPKSPIQTDNSSAAGVFNNTIVPRKLNTMDRRLHWLRCREPQGQF